MVLNILCNGVVSYRDEAQYCKSFIDDTFSKTCSVKLWPVLGFLNTQVEKKDTLTLFNEEGFNATQTPFSKNWDPFQWLIIQGRKLPKKRGIYMIRSIILSNILTLKNINKHAWEPLKLTNDRKMI